MDSCTRKQNLSNVTSWIPIRGHYAWRTRKYFSSLSLCSADENYTLLHEIGNTIINNIASSTFYPQLHLQDIISDLFQNSLLIVIFWKFHVNKEHRFSTRDIWPICLETVYMHINPSATCADASTHAHTHTTNQPNKQISNQPTNQTTKQPTKQTNKHDHTTTHTHTRNRRLFWGDTSANWED